jgi:hypothetical protein
LRPPFVNRLYPAETRLKEGARAHDFNAHRWECSLAAGGWRPAARFPQYRGTIAAVSNAQATIGSRLDDTDEADPADAVSAHFVVRMSPNWRSLDASRWLS